MMKIINKSRKIIGINGEPLLPGASMELADGAENNPAIKDYINRGILADAKNSPVIADMGGISDIEKVRIAEEAVAKYKAEQENAAQTEKEAEIKAVQTMRKSELLTKAARMGLEVKDDDTVEILREKILAALGKQ